jgi:2-(1,2-epoxy-1,2-dihydrophenyl)acetyl-CoA isomerase
MVGTAKARELYYLSSVLTATEAKELGIINAVATDEELQATANKFIDQIANGPSTALRYMKQNMNLAEEGNLIASLDSEALYQTLCRDTEDHQNAAKSFVAKEKPVFTGR